MARHRKYKTQQMTLGAVLTALVVVLQLVGSFIHLGAFSVSLVLVPIVVGAATCGPYIGAWLGLTFGAVVLFSGDATFFLQFNAPATIALVLVKGTAAGLLAGFVYRLMSKLGDYAGVVSAAIVCPLVNTGLFLGGCFLFFQDAVAVLAEGAGFTGSLTAFMFVGLAGGNFLFELIVNLVLCPLIVRLLAIRRQQSTM